MFATNHVSIVFPFEKKSYRNFMIFFVGRFWPKLTFLGQIEDNVSWLPRSNDHFAIWEPFLDPIWVHEA